MRTDGEEVSVATVVKSGVRRHAGMNAAEDADQAEQDDQRRK